MSIVNCQLFAARQLSRRVDRINELIKEEISKILLKEIDFKDALVTVTQVDTSIDLKHAKIYISVMPSGKKASVLRGLQSSIFEVQQTLNKRLNMKFIPKIRFEIDKSQARIGRINEILKEVRENESKNKK